MIEKEKTQLIIIRMNVSPLIRLRPKCIYLKKKRRLQVIQKHSGFLVMLSFFSTEIIKFCACSFKVSETDIGRQKHKQRQRKQERKRERE